MGTGSGNATPQEEMEQKEPLESYLVRLRVIPPNPDLDAAPIANAILELLGPEPPVLAIITRPDLVPKELQIRLDPPSAPGLHRVVEGINRVLFEIYQFQTDERLHGVRIAGVVIWDPLYREDQFDWPKGDISHQRFMNDALMWFLEHTDLLRAKVQRAISTAVD